MSLNSSGLLVVKGLDINNDGARVMIQQSRRGPSTASARPPSWEKSKATKSMWSRDTRVIPRPSKKGRPGRRRRLKGERGWGTLAKEKPPIFGMSQRGGEVVIRMLEDVKQVTIGPLIKRTIAEGSTVFTDECDIHSRLTEWGCGHETVCDAAGEDARGDDGDGFCEVHVNTLEGF